MPEVGLLCASGVKEHKECPMQFGRVIQLRLEIQASREDEAKPWISRLVTNEVPVDPAT